MAGFDFPGAKKATDAIQLTPKVNAADFQKPNYAIKLDPDPQGWIAVATHTILNGTPKQAAVWTIFAILASTALAAFHMIPWSQRAGRRFHIFPFAATVLAAVFYLLIAMGYVSNSARVCKTYHLASSPENDEPDDWQPGSVKGLPRYDVCYVPAGLDWPAQRFILLMWIGELATYALNSLSSGFSVFGIISIFDNHKPGSSEKWGFVLDYWDCVTGVLFLGYIFYKMAIHNDARARKFFFTLAGCLAASYGIQELVKLWASSYDMPIYQHYIAHGIIDVLRNSGLSLWLLHTNIPDMGLAEDQAVGHPEPSFGLSETILVVRATQVMYWYYTQTNG